MRTNRSAGAVAAGHEAVARVGADIIERGGNAVDAVVAMIAAGCVCEPTLTSLGGGGFLIVGGGADDLDPVLLDCFVRQPGLVRRDWLAPWEVHALELDGTILRYGTGPASVAVPGLPRGMAHASRRHGRLAFAETLAPAAELASQGVPLTRTQAGEHVANAPLIARDEEGRRVWFVDGDRVRDEGEIFCQPELARAIELLGETDGESMYVGEIADAFVRWSDQRGGRISHADLERYVVEERTPLQLCVDDICMFANPEPSMGGSITLRLLQEMLDRLEPALTGAGRRASRDLVVGRALVQVLQQLDPPRTHPPQHGELVLDALVSGAMSDDLRESVADVMHNRGARVPDDDLPSGLSRSPNTTHVSAIDADGLMCGATTTVGYGAGEFVPGFGIHLNNMLAEYDHTIVRMPGSTVPSMMTPTILTSPRSLVQLGSAGSDRIPHALAQILERMWRGAPLEEAIRAPRFAWDGRALHAEPGLDEDALELLGQEHELVRWTGRDPFFGTTNGTALRGGRPFASGDPRREAVGIVL